MNYKTIHLDSFPSTKIYVKLASGLRKRIFISAKRKLPCHSDYELAMWLNKQSNKYGSGTKFNGGDVKYWLLGERMDIRTQIKHPKYIPLWALLELCKAVSIPLRTIERSVLSYRSGGSGTPIANPKLPIMATPEFASLAIHLICDGYVGKSTPNYCQKNFESRTNFIKKLQNCFGGIRMWFDGEKILRFSKAVPDILSQHYLIDSYYSHDAKIPIQIMNGDFMTKLACITSFIVDEGNVRDMIVFTSINYVLLSQIRTLAADCGYICRDIKQNKKSGVYNFYMSNTTIEKFAEDVRALSSRFPTCGLCNKTENLDDILRRRLKNNRGTDAKKCILECLANGRKLTIKEIATKSDYAYCTVTHCLAKLFKMGRVQREPSGQTFLWRA